MIGERFLGLDLGGTNVKAVVLEMQSGGPEVVFTAQHPTHAERGPRGVTDRLIEIGRLTIAEVGPVTRVGLGVPGLFDPPSGEILLFPNLPGQWKGHPLRDPVAAGIGVSATIINDARAFVLAEGTMGAGAGHSTLVGVTLGTGIGGGIMIDGRVHLGDTGRAGEIAHQIVLPDGPLCGCGNRGCVEALAKADALSELAGAPDVETVYERAEAGDERSRQAISTVADYIGIGLANIVTVIGPSCIVIGGGIMVSGERVLGPIRRAMESHLTLVPEGSVHVVAAALGKWAGGIGAALAGSTVE